MGRSSGMFSNWVLSREYGRDNPSFEEKPNAVVFIGEHYGENVEKISGYAGKTIPVAKLPASSYPQNMNLLFEDQKKKLLSEYISRWGKAKYRAGVEEGRTASRNEYQRGLAEGRKLAEELIEKQGRKDINKVIRLVEEMREMANR